MHSHGLLVLLTIEFILAPMIMSREGNLAFSLVHAGFQLVIFIYLLGIVRHSSLAGVCSLLLIAGTVVRLNSREPNGWMAGFANASNAAAAAIVLFVAVRQFVAIADVSAATISSALAVYLLAGILWSLLYALIESAQPGSFLIGGEPVKREDLHCFSYITMITLGYGDVVPQRDWARSCALSQALLGQVFIAVIIGRLVAIQVSRGRIQAITGKQR